MRNSGCLKGCAIGCAVVTVLVLALLVLGGVRMFQWMGAFDDAIETRAALEQGYPTLESYDPPPDGRILSDRVEVFLRVREGILQACGELSEVVSALDGAVGEMNALEESGEEPGIEDVPWLAIGRTVGSAFSLVPAIGRFAKARNASLLEQEMGFGEYAWIFSAAYRPSSPEPSPAARREGLQFDDTSERVRRGLIEMMDRTLATIEAQEKPTEESLEFAEALRAETAALRAEHERAPWVGGLPDSLEASFVPYRDRLEALACPAIREFELARHQKQKGMSITVD